MDLRRAVPLVALISMIAIMASSCGGSQASSTDQGAGTPQETSTTQASGVETTAGTARDTGTTEAAGGETAAGDDLSAVIADFQRLVYTDPAYNNETLMYSIYVPEDYDASKSYPLVLFMHDSSLISSDPTKALTACKGATIWATPSEQAKRECIVVVPQYNTSEAVVNDNSEASEYLDITVDLVKSLETQYNIDAGRIYNTGQSMGGMMSIAMDIKYPDLFAASLLVACQWDATLVTPMATDNLWIVVSEGDRKAYPGMNAITEALKAAGAKASSATWDPQASAEEFAIDVSQMIAEGSNVNYTVLQGGDHMSTFPIGYSIEGIRDWLFAQSKAAS